MTVSGLAHDFHPKLSSRASSRYSQEDVKKLAQAERCGAVPKGLVW